MCIYVVQVTYNQIRVCVCVCVCACKHLNNKQHYTIIQDNDYNTASTGRIITSRNNMFL